MHRIVSLAVALPVLIFATLLARLYVTGNNFQQLDTYYLVVPPLVVLATFTVGLVNLWVGIRPQSSIARQFQAAVAATVLFGVAVVVACIVQFRFPGMLASALAAFAGIAIIHTTFRPARH